jgi:general secretion pathway protein E
MIDGVVDTPDKVYDINPQTSVDVEAAAEEALSNMPRINVLRQTPTPEALQLIPENLARKYNVIPLSVERNTLKVAMANPDDVLAIEALSARTKKRIEPVSAQLIDVKEAIDFNYRAFSTIADQVGSVESKANETDSEVSIIETKDDSPVARALNLVLEEGVKSRASDIHIEPEEDKIHIRYRIDGILHDVLSLPVGIHLPFISRIKILAGMNIADHRRPQDGQFTFEAVGKEIDVRVATINTIHGEMTVMRLLDKSMGALSLSKIGFLHESQRKFEQMLAVPYGMVLVSGPTGAGKTTTLYSAVNSLDKTTRKIITLEDPVEYRFEGMSQVQINQRAGLTFASGLRSIVRLDPDVIMVGEIRDSETAQTAVQSALTGHLVLSSVHANDTVSVLFRLIDLGVEPFLICSSIVGIIAQRMVRRVCPYCNKEIEVPLVEQIAYQAETGDERSTFYYGEGCKACVYSGYLGRTGIFELLIMNDELRQMLVSGASAAQIRAQAVKDGLVSIAKDGMLKAKAGITTPYEVLRNAYSAA